MKKTAGGILLADDTQAEKPLAVNEVRYDWDVDFARGTVTQIIRRGPIEPGGSEQEPVIVNMALADLMELAASLTLQSIAFTREQVAAFQRRNGQAS